MCWFKLLRQIQPELLRKTFVTFIMKHPVFGFVKSSPFYHFWWMTRHSQTDNAPAKFHISLQRGRIAGQFLHLNFDLKNSHFFTLDRQKLAKSACLVAAVKIQSFLVTFRKLRITAKLVIPRPSYTYHYKEEGLPISFSIGTLRVKIPNFGHSTNKNWQNRHVWAPLTKSCPFFVTFGKLCTTAKPIMPQPSFIYH